MLAEFRLIPGLNNLFDKLIWRKYTTSNHVVHGQNENCDCSPVSFEIIYSLIHCFLLPIILIDHVMLLFIAQEISFKIQFLRLLQSFSDHHE